ncbi:hypothetical protein C8R44DRAFT_861886 [Mycena epipterygia]|nr:hypothetical protein C8R44DRAFT_861886 [Mycena epipterygia]
MSCPPTPHTARPMYSTSPSPPYDDQTRTPRPSDYHQHLVHAAQPLPLPWLEGRKKQPPNEQPRHTAATTHLWNGLPNTSRRANISVYGPPDDVRVGADEFGGHVVYDAGMPLKFLNANAAEFRPTSRPASSMSISSSRSSTSARSSAASAISVATAATSVSAARSSAGKSPAPRGSPAPPSSPIPVFPHIEPGERAYKAYRDRLRAEDNVHTPIQCILETGVGNYELTQHIAILADRLSSSARCGPAEFKARLRAEALELFRSYWRNDDGPWRTESPARCQYLTSRGINIAAFVGSLYRYELVSGADAHGCLDVLLSTGLSFLKLQAAHALFVHCGQRICAGHTGLDTALVRTRLGARGPDGRYVWGPHAESHALLEDLLENLDRWFASQEMDRIRSDAAFLSPTSATVRPRHASAAAPRPARLPVPMNGYGYIMQFTIFLLVRSKFVVVSLFQFIAEVKASEDREDYIGSQRKQKDLH